MKLLTVVGARPQFVKAATVSRVIKDNENISEILVHTGQHFDENMSKIFFEQMSIPNPDYDLGVSGGGHGKMTGRMLESLESLMIKEKPDCVLVYGDTNSTLAGALSAAKLHIPIAHVEAGLRSYNMLMPEEINRVITDRISNILFCPTTQAEENLKKEGFDSLSLEILKVGDVMLDAAYFYRGKANMPHDFPVNLDLGRPFALTTIHRAENADDPVRLKAIIDGLNEVHSTLPVVLIVHPRTKLKLKEFNIEPNIHLVDPVGYFEMIWLLEQCALVVTDSGGLQKEAWFFHKPCITLREETEWVELINAGGNQLIKVGIDNIVSSAEDVLKKKVDYSMNLYGKGDAANRIVDKLISS